MTKFSYTRSSIKTKNITPFQDTSAVANDFLFEVAQVEEVIFNESLLHESLTSAPAGIPNTNEGFSNVGRIRFRFLHTESGASSKNLPSADPMVVHQTIFPLVGEYVLVFRVKELSKYFYIGPLNIKRKVTENATPLIGNLLDSLSNTNSPQKNLSRRLGITTEKSTVENRAGVNFEELKVNPIKVFEGDIVYQGRYGQSIRMGSSLLTKASAGKQRANIIIRVGQSPEVTKTGEGTEALVNESINKDPSSIWMVEDQNIPLVPATYGTNIYLRSTFAKPIYDGAQVIVNSDRVVLNSKKTSIFLFSNKGIHLSSLDDGFTVDTSGEIILRTPNNISVLSEKTSIFESKEDSVFNTKRDIIVSADRNLTLHGKEIFIGGRAVSAEPIVMGTSLKNFFIELIRVLMSTSPLVLGPTGVINPAVIARLLLVYAKYKVVIGPINAKWSSDDNFVMKVNEKTLASNLPSTEGVKTTRPDQLIAKFGREYKKI